MQKSKVVKFVKKGSISKLRKYLKKNDVNLNRIRDNEGRSMLHLSCYLGDYKMTRYLLRNGVDPCLTDDDGNTALHIALKYALESYKNTMLYDLIYYLKRKSRRVMNLANMFGETPNDLYTKWNSIMTSTFVEEDEVKQKLNEEEEEWQKKLAYEESCEDYYFKQDETPQEDLSETYNDWAERIRQEYFSKHKRTAGFNISHQHKEREVDCKWKEELTKQLAEGHDNYIRRTRLKKMERERERYEDMCHNVFENGGMKPLSFDTIPWPCIGSAADIVDKLCEWAEDEKITYLKRQRIRWHPDKFAQRCRHRIKENDLSIIMDLVKEISQGINMMLSSL